MNKFTSTFAVFTRCKSKREQKEPYGSFVFLTGLGRMLKLR